jgi:hypothetical protein
MLLNKYGYLFALAVCLGSLFCTQAFCDTPDIHFTNVPAYGTYGSLTGNVSGVAYANYKVLVYIYVYGWWNKPTWANPLTSINPDGSWTCLIAGGASDTLATEIIAFLIPNGAYQSSWQMAGNASLPAELYFYPYADIHRTPASRAIQFAGHNWAVKVGDDMGPGPNHFSDSVNNVWVDGNGYLHLKITHPDSNWYCSEIISDESFGYGTYVFTVDSRIDTLDRNIILGLFTWDSYAPQYNYREIDFEFGTWQNPADDNCQFVIQPWDRPGNRYRFDVDNTGGRTTTTHVMTWRADGIYFKSYYGNFSLAPAPETVIRDWYYTGSYNPPPGGENIRMNLWLILGTPPSNGLTSEVVIKDFQFLTNIGDRPGDINNDSAVNLLDLSQISAHWQQSGCNKNNTWCNRTDLNCNGSIDITDLLAFSAYWLQDSLP